MFNLITDYDLNIYEFKRIYNLDVLYANLILISKSHTMHLMFYNTMLNVHKYTILENKTLLLIR